MRKGALLFMVVSGMAAPAGWFGSSALESRNEFCVACHVDSTQQLHQAKFDDFRTEPPASLVALHHAARSPDEDEFRCIDCHGGASFPNQFRVKLVAARDAARWLIGDFVEPESMRHPLWDEDCAQCHPSYSPERDDSFHAIADHNVDFEHACVECHGAHSQDVAPELYFLDREAVLPVCRNCHEEF